MSDERAPTSDDIPTTIGRYQVTGSLGVGAMGAVYKAFDPLIKRTLAIKTIRLDIPRNSPQHKAFIDRFYQEARISGTLSHPNIVTLFDIGEENGLPFLAMEYVDGRTIASVLDEGVRYKPERVVALVSQVAAALDYAHSRGVVHRDIKPSNLIVHDGEKVKVTDFGIAKLADSEITHAGALLGTPSYMSPEQAMGEKLDGRSDIFSLGVCAFEMLSGQQPFPGANVTSILYKLVHVDPIEPPDLELNGLVPQKWREVFSRVLAKKPANRYQTAGAFVEDLEYCLGSWFSGIGDAAAPTVTTSIGGEETVTVQRPAIDGTTAASDIETLVHTPPGGLPSVAPPSEADMPTVRLAPPSAVAASRVAAPPPSSPRGPEDSGATMSLEEPPPPPTILIAPRSGASGGPPPLPATAAGPEIPAPAGLEPTTTAAALPTAVSPGPRPGPPLGAVVAAVTALLLIAAGIVGWALWKRAHVPSGEAAVVPTPAATVVAPGATPTPTAAPTSGSLRIVSEPAGARVRLDGETKGETPLDIAGLPFGSHDVRVERRGFDPQVRTVELSAEAPDAEVTVSLTRAAPTTGVADVVSTPAGAAVSVDGKPSGRTPLAGLVLRPGTRRLEIALEGHEPWTGTVDVVAGKKGRVDVNLRPIPVARPAPVPEPVDTARVYGENDVDTPARKRSGDSPSYPREGAPRLRSGQRVSVVVRFVVDDKGNVQDVSIVESAGKVVDAAVIQAVRSWKYEPAVKRGAKVRSQMLFKQTFLGG
jgi:serine/threonine-protein kinase